MCGGIVASLELSRFRGDDARGVEVAHSTIHRLTQIHVVLELASTFSYSS